MASNIDYRDYTTIAGVKDFVTNDIAPKYFPDIETVSKLNVGLFGMLVDVESTGLFDVMQVASRYITEIIPGKSQLPEFIYANANNYGITDLFAKCAHCEGTLLIKEDDILRNGIKYNNGYIEYTISSDSTVFIDNVPFSLPYDIRIRSIKIDGAYNHHCVYDQSVKNSVITSILPYAYCVKTHIVNESATYLAITVDLYQYLKVYQEENITTNNILNIPFIDVNFSDNICNFEVFYRGPNSSNFVQLDKLMETSPAQTTPFVYYKIIDEDGYRLSFANDDRYFVPEYNSELKIVSFQTLGKDGNFNTYNGDNVYVSSTDTNVPLHFIMATSSQGGKSSNTLEEIRRLTWERMLTVNSYTTDSDLNTYFSLTETPSGSTKSYFIKIRDDFTTRIIACYTRLRNELNIFPTNTLDAIINVDDIDENYYRDHKFIIHAGSRFVYDDDNSTCKIIPDDVEGPSDGIEYTNIALMSIRTSPTNTISYYMNSIDKDILVTYDYLNDNALHQFIVKKLHVKRNAVAGESSYKFTMILQPSDLTISTATAAIEADSGIDASGDSFRIINDEDQVTGYFDPTKLKVFMHIPGSNDTNDISHYVEFEYDNSSSSTSGYIFTGTLETDDMVSDDKIQLINVNHTGEDSDTFCTIAMQDPNIIFMVFYDEGTSDINTFENILPGVTNYRLCNQYKARKGDLYFAYPMSLMESVLSYKDIERPENCTMFTSGNRYEKGDLVYKFDDNDSELRFKCLEGGVYDYIDDPYWESVVTYKFFVQNIPLFGRKFLKDENNMSEVLSSLTTHYNRLRDIMVDMTANFSLSLRFFNTYGHSSIFSITNGRGDIYTLNRTNCDISFSIKFNENTNYLGIIDNIKHTIKTYIESISDTDDRTPSSINKVNISNLIKKLHDTYASEIDYIIFNSINGYNSSYQNIDLTVDLTLPENNRRIPEFLTLSLDDIEIKILNTTA